MAAPSKVWTREEVLALQDAATNGVRYELIDGELLASPSPNDPHQRCVSLLLYFLVGYCRPHRVGWAMTSPADLSLDRESILQPDVFVVPWHTPAASRGWEHVTRLRLAVNVLSPSTARGDRTVKRRYLQRMGVPEYWIVDHRARLVERWRPDDERPEIVTGTLPWHPDAAIEPLRIDLPELFTEALGPVTVDLSGGE
ncbi:MAG: Uma2 family endonuclease [Gemmatirosa sp.]|nr:Uma2 family endonuclease [Gemmatirosa sp.]